MGFMFGKSRVVLDLCGEQRGEKLAATVVAEVQGIA